MYGGLVKLHQFMYHGITCPQTKFGPRQCFQSAKSQGISEHGGGCLVLGGGAWSTGGGGYLVETPPPPDGYCSGMHSGMHSNCENNVRFFNLFHAV